MRYGRIYRLHSHEGIGSPRQLNTDNFIILEVKSDQVRVTPKPYGGIPVSQHEIFQKQLQQELADFDRDVNYIAIAVWEDSFDRFVHFKNEMVDQGIEYRLIPLQDDDIILEGGDGRSHVQ